ncbi:MAG: flagellar basal body-associated FliL family protein [Treponema sp.]|jgi:flagellar basal body-associated protein FliL|nr:flagellar basal body-associated FliL family protein [Treponema sp.]
MNKAASPSVKPPATPLVGFLSKVGGILYRFLWALVLLLILVLAGVTVYALVLRNPGARPLYTLPDRVIPAFSRKETQEPRAMDGMFTGIGRFRVVTADTPPMTIVISIVFPYRPEDRAFAEELDSKVRDFRNITAAYFSAHTAAELRQANESQIKAEMVRRYNDMLHLGQIEVLYFHDFMIIE